MAAKTQTANVVWEDFRQAWAVDCAKCGVYVAFGDEGLARLVARDHRCEERQQPAPRVTA